MSHKAHEALSLNKALTRSSKTERSADSSLKVLKAPLLLEGKAGRACLLFPLGDITLVAHQDDRNRATQLRNVPQEVRHIAPQGCRAMSSQKAHSANTAACKLSDLQEPICGWHQDARDPMSYMRMAAFQALFEVQ